jgi:hypothetical protein
VESSSQELQVIQMLEVKVERSEQQEKNEAALMFGNLLPLCLRSQSLPVMAGVRVDSSH